MTNRKYELAEGSDIPDEDVTMADGSNLADVRDELIEDIREAAAAQGGRPSPGTG